MRMGERICQLVRTCLHFVTCIFCDRRVEIIIQTGHTGALHRKKNTLHESGLVTLATVYETRYCRVCKLFATGKLTSTPNNKRANQEACSCLVERIVIGINIMKKELLQILQHSLGVDQYGNGEQYRNSFVTGPESDDFEYCSQLVADGLMEGFGPQKAAGGMHFFRVTRKGKNMMSEESPKPPRLTRSQKRYRDFLSADWFDGNFGDWLRQGCFR